jgi:homoserine O-acetyltransferase
LYITKALDYFDLHEGKSLSAVLKGVTAKFLVIAFKSDWLYPAYQSREIVKACKLSGVDATYCELHSQYGHDAFLLEIGEQEYLVKHFLNNISDGNGNGRK